MIDFISTNVTTNSLGRLLSVYELMERRKRSSKGILKLYGFLVSSKGKFYKASTCPIEINFRSDGDIRRFIYGSEPEPKTKSTKNKGHRFDRYIAFTKKEKMEEFYKKSVHRDNVRWSIDRSQYYTEVYD